MRLRGGLIVAGGLALAAGLAAYALWRRNVTGGRSLAEELAGARREGLPVDPEDLLEPPVSDAENGAIPYLRAAELARQVRETTARNRKVDTLLIVKGSMGKVRPLETLSRAERKQLRGLLDLDAPAFAALREAVRRPRFVLNRPWHLNYGWVDLDEVRMFGLLVKSLILRSRLRDREGDFDGAEEDLMLATRATALLRHGITPYEDQWRRTLEEGVLAQAVRHPEDPGFPLRVRNRVRLLGPPPDLRRVYRTVLVVKRRQLVYEGATQPTTMRLRTVREATEAHFIAYWRTLQRRLPQDPFAFETARSVMERTMDEFYADDAWSLTRTEHPFVPTDLDDLARGEARRRIALAAADVVAFRHRHRQWPSTLPKPYGDPFGGPLRYRAEPSGFVVYSIDADRRDDHGKPIATRPGETSDLACRIQIPRDGLPLTGRTISRPNR